MDEGLMDQDLQDPASAVISWPDVHIEATQADFQDWFQAALWISGTYSSAHTRLPAQLQDTTVSTGQVFPVVSCQISQPWTRPCGLTNLGHFSFKDSCEFLL